MFLIIRLPTGYYSLHYITFHEADKKDAGRQIFQAWSELVTKDLSQHLKTALQLSANFKKVSYSQVADLTKILATAKKSPAELNIYVESSPLRLQFIIFALLN